MLLKFIFYLCCLLCPLTFVSYFDGIKKEKEQKKDMSASTAYLFYVCIFSLAYILTYLF